MQVVCSDTSGSTEKLFDGLESVSLAEEEIDDKLTQQAGKIINKSSTCNEICVLQTSLGKSYVKIRSPLVS